MATKKKEPAAATKPRSKTTKSVTVAPAPVDTALAPAEGLAVVDVAPPEAAPVDVAPPEAPPARPAPSHDAIAARASQIWSERGGSAFDNWIQAERELGA